MKIAIIGAGASGLASAILLAQKHHDVTVYEANNKVGKKLLATGNGRCNISNNNISIDNFHGMHVELISALLKQYSTKDIVDFFRFIGLELIELDNKKLFPLSLQAASVVKLLENRALSLGVKIQLNTKITEITKDKIFKLQANNTIFVYDAVIISTGSKASKKLGGTTLGYDIASSFGHTIIPTHPSLTALLSNDSFLKELDGVKIDSILQLKHNNNNLAYASGDIMFRDYGVSGLASLDISREVSISNFNNYELIIDLLPIINREKLISILGKIKINLPNSSLAQFLEGIIHSKLTNIIIEKSKIYNRLTAQELTKKDINTIAYIIKNFTININGVRGFDFCEVSTGGVSLQEINLKTMESKKVKNLYFTGEVLDIDGDRGGFNLHFAWITALAIDI